MTSEITAYIGLGSNLGDRELSIRTALKMLGKSGNVRINNVSDLIQTPPLGGIDQPDYLNAVAEAQTILSPQEMHKTLQDIETSLGRKRNDKWSSRVIDLDLLLYGSQVLETDNLIIPHQQLHLRSFVLKGLCQLNKNLVHPILNRTMQELAGRLSGKDYFLNLELPQLISIAGLIGVGKTTLVKAMADCLQCRKLLEPYDKNPFLPKVYAGQTDLALNSQLYFLCSRLDQLDKYLLEPGQIAISDYIFQKELIYARGLLNNEQFQLYEKIYKIVSTRITVPVLVIYMHDSVQNCLDRIHNRNRPYEQNIEPEFLNNLDKGYEELFKNWDYCPVIRLSRSQFDCRKSSDMEDLIKQIRYYTSLEYSSSVETI